MDVQKVTVDMMVFWTVIYTAYYKTKFCDLDIVR